MVTTFCIFKIEITFGNWKNKLYVPVLLHFMKLVNISCNDLDPLWMFALEKHSLLLLTLLKALALPHSFN